jgi:hypothetical protein
LSLIELQPLRLPLVQKLTVPSPIPLIFRCHLLNCLKVYFPFLCHCLRKSFSGDWFQVQLEYMLVQFRHPTVLLLHRPMSQCSVLAQMRCSRHVVQLLGYLQVLDPLEPG